MQCRGWWFPSITEVSVTLEVGFSLRTPLQLARTVQKGDHPRGHPCNATIGGARGNFSVSKELHIRLFETNGKFSQTPNEQQKKTNRLSIRTRRSNYEKHTLALSSRFCCSFPTLSGTTQTRNRDIGRRICCYGYGLFVDTFRLITRREKSLPDP